MGRPGRQKVGQARSTESWAGQVDRQLGRPGRQKVGQAMLSQSWAESVDGQSLSTESWAGHVDEKFGGCGRQRVVQSSSTESWAGQVDRKLGSRYDLLFVSMVAAICEEVLIKPLGACVVQAQLDNLLGSRSVEVVCEKTLEAQRE